MRCRNFVNLNYDPNTLDYDQAKARKRKKLCFKLSIAFFAFVLGVGVGIGLCSLFVYKVLFSGFLNSQAPTVPVLAHRGIFSSHGSAWTAMSKWWKKSTIFNFWLLSQSTRKLIFQYRKLFKNIKGLFSEIQFYKFLRKLTKIRSLNFRLWWWSEKIVTHRLMKRKFSIKVKTKQINCIKFWLITVV